jgi:hypothetical protein
MGLAQVVNPGIQYTGPRLRHDLGLTVVFCLIPVVAQ